MTETSERTLVAAAKVGSHGAFAALFEAHHPRLLRYLERQARDRELAADVAQEAFLDAIRHLDLLDGDRPFAPWLYRIAQNRLRMAYRRVLRDRPATLDRIPEQAAAGSEPLRLPDVALGVSELAGIEHVLDQLSPDLRDALLLHSLAGFAGRQVAEILGISLSAAERRISRAHLDFRVRYDALVGDPEPGIDRGAESAERLSEKGVVP